MDPQPGIIETSLAQRESLLRITAPESFRQALERVVGTNDILPLNFLALGQLAAKAVARIIVPQPGGNTFFGTGFLVAPRLLMTNYHVFDEEPATSGFALADLATNAIAEFDFELDTSGIPIDSTRFRLRPDEFLAFSLPDALDYVLVAVEPVSLDLPQKPLPEFGYLKLVSLVGKARVDEKLTVIHHPKGGFKSISIRDKRLTEFVDENFIQYEADTEPGSSGAPIFNDQWLVVALHQKGVAATNAAGEVLNRDGSVHQPGQADERIDWIANRGIRISAIIASLKATFPDHPLLAPVFSLSLLKNVPPASESTEKPTVPMPVSSPVSSPSPAPMNTTDPSVAAAAQTIQFTIPLDITVRVGAITGPGMPVLPAPSTPPPAPSFEKQRPSAGSYVGRNGYDPAFLAGTNLSLDKLLAPLSEQLAPTFDGKTVLAYRNFSVAINRNRRMTIVTAVNIDGKRSQNMGRSDIWILDPRMNEQFQTGPEVYTNNDLDRGHMVRRLDPVWGDQAAQANVDTFHYTNSCPQHKDLNQKTWNDLEDFVLNNTKLEKLRVSVFTGPVFSEADIPYRGVLLPLQFWKVAAVIKKDGKLSVSGYMLSQKDLLTRLTESVGEDGFGQYRTYQVPLTLIQQLTKLDFSPYFGNDPLHRTGATPSEAATDLREIGPDAAEPLL